MLRVIVVDSFETKPGDNTAALGYAATTDVNTVRRFEPTSANLKPLTVQESGVLFVAKKATGQAWAHEIAHVIVGEYEQPKRCEDAVHTDCNDERPNLLWPLTKPLNSVGGKRFNGKQFDLLNRSNRYVEYPHHDRAKSTARKADGCIPVVSGWVVVVALFMLGTGLGETGQDADAVVRNICRRVYTEGATDADLQRETDQIAALGEPGRKALVKRARSGGHEGDRAMSFLLRLGDLRALEVTRKLLSDRKSTPELKKRALNAVAYSRDVESTAMVLELFRSAEDEDVAREAAGALSVLRDEGGLRAMREALSDPRYKRLEGDLVRAVGVPDHEEAVAPLVRLLDQPAYRNNEAARGMVNGKPHADRDPGQLEAGRGHRQDHRHLRSRGRR
jgi:hypothetical protein